MTPTYFGNVAHPARLLMAVGAVFSFAATSLAAPPSGLPHERAGRVVTYPAFPTGDLPLKPRVVNVLLPIGYEQSDQRYPVFYVHDGGTFEGFGLRREHDRLVAEGTIDPVIFVGIAHNDRSFELTPPRLRSDRKGGGGIEHYFHLIRDHIKPLVDRDYRTRPGPEHTGVIGASYGGLASFYLAYHHPEVFRMAGCLSPAFGYDQGRILDQVADDERGHLPIRFYFDAGPWEGEMPAQAHRMATTLIEHGWQQGRDVAWYHDPRGIHIQFDWARRSRSLLAFLLRDQPTVTFTSAWIERYQQINLPQATRPRAMHQALSLWLDRSHRQGAILQRWSPLGILISELHPRFQVDDSAVVQIDSTGPGRLNPIKPGVTTLYSDAAGERVSLPLMVQKLDDYPTVAAATAPPKVVIDGRLDDWWHLPLIVSSDHHAFWPSEGHRGPADGSYRFAVAYDEQFVYFAVDVTDESIIAEADKAPWSQDGLEIRIDGRPNGPRSHGMGEGEGEAFLLLAMSPTYAHPHDPGSLPDGTQSRIMRTAGGYSLEAAVPIEYFNQQQDGKWQALRVNVVMNDRDSSDGPTTKLWWQPDWRFPENVLASGTFIRPGQ